MLPLFHMDKFHKTEFSIYNNSMLSAQGYNNVTIV